MSLDRRVSGRWEHLSQLTGIAIGAKQTGWDRLTQAILDDPSVRLRAVRRMEAIVNLCRLLTRLSEHHFVILALRYGLTVDDRVVAERSPRDVAEKARQPESRIIQLEQEAIEDLRRRARTEFPAMEAFVYRATTTCVAAD
jgi:DNA-directed RNA polymerase sigma subunit (sigma70/sigma32)